jgi:RNA polymerase sigma factor (sigma-70 family)
LDKLADTNHESGRRTDIQSTTSLICGYIGLFLVKSSTMDDVLPFIQACLAGDNVRWERVRTIALNFLRSRNSALVDDHSDIVQNVIIKLLKGFRQFNGTTEKELRQYINVTTLREAVSFYRKNARLQSHDSLDQSLDDDSDSTLHDVLPDTHLDPAAVSAINDLFQKAAIQLSVRDKQIILYKAEGYKDREIAEMLGMTPGGVAVTYNRTKELLRRTLLAMLLIILFGRKLPWMTSL